MIKKCAWFLIFFLDKAVCMQNTSDAFVCKSTETLQVAPSRVITAVAVHPYKKSIVAEGCSNGRLLVWKDGLMHKFFSRKGWSSIRALAFDECKPYLLYAFYSDGKLFTWDCRKEREKGNSLDLDQNGSRVACFCPCKSDYLATYSDDGTIKIFKWKGEKIVHLSTKVKDAISLLCFNPNKKHSLIAYHSDGGIYSWGLSREVITKKMICKYEGVSFMFFDVKNSDHLLLYSVDGTIRKCSLTSCKCLNMINTVRAWTGWMQFYTGHEYVLVSVYGKTIKVQRLISKLLSKNNKMYLEELIALLLPGLT